MRHLLVLFTASLALAFAPLACGGGSTHPNADGGAHDSGTVDSGMPDGGHLDSGTDAGTDAGTNDGGVHDAGTDAGTDGGSTPVCNAEGEGCTANGLSCCSGSCGQDGTCNQPTFCRNVSEACTSSAQCCSGVCSNGFCAGDQCKPNGVSCGGNAECCTGICGSGGTCQNSPSSPGCGVTGSSCTSGTNCCSTNCDNGICAAAYSCQAEGDVCYQGLDCCSGACSTTDGGAGVCVVPAAPGGGNCGEDGQPCSSGTNCCSRVCVDPGSGVTVCQPAGGCRLTGDACHLDQECCGGGTNPNGTATCSGSDAGAGIVGRCDNGQSCNPEGNICGAPVLPDGGSINASQNCCDGQKAVCKLSSEGIPRCFGGGVGDGGTGTCPTGYTGEAPCCIAEADQCQFSDQCCDGLPCVPNPDGGGNLVCFRPTCEGLGTNCALPDGGPNSSLCCAGSVCAPSGELGYSCQLPPSDGGTGDGGTTDAGACSGNGSTCGTASDCCSGICGVGADGGQQCLAPEACIPQSGACTQSGDCCSGLSCQFSGGNGTCQPSVCANAGQTCSPTQGCCTGLLCENAAYQNCDGTSPCTCIVPIN